jgi:hypothetical protein
MAEVGDEDLILYATGFLLRSLFPSLFLPSILSPLTPFLFLYFLFWFEPRASH